MPVIKSAIKRVKTNETANKRNASRLSMMRTAVRDFERAKANGADNVESAFHNALSKIDRTKSKGLIKANKASRDKARLTRLYKK